MAEPRPPGWSPAPPSARERRRAGLLFAATLASVYLVYGFQWLGGNPLVDAEVAAGSARFAVGLMAILAAHEMGHYLVARRHGFRLSLPHFIPFPWAFGTLGAIIRLRSLPRTRTGLVEMGAAGPLAGFAVALLVMALGLPGTAEHARPEVVVPSALAAADPGALEALLRGLADAGAGARDVPDSFPMMILANPPAMDLLGVLLNGHPPGRYATLDPLAMAGWVGCLLTAINLLPIGQLDGGHVFNGMAPRRAPLVARAGVVAAFAAGVLWPGWAVWGVLLVVVRAWRSLPVPLDPPPTARARTMALAALGAFALSFMPRPLEVEDVPLDGIDFVTEDGRPVPEAAVRAWLGGALPDAAEEER